MRARACGSVSERRARPSGIQSPIPAARFAEAQGRRPRIAFRARTSSRADSRDPAGPPARTRSRGSAGIRRLRDEGLPTRAEVQCLVPCSPRIAPSRHPASNPILWHHREERSIGFAQLTTANVLDPDSRPEPTVPRAAEGDARDVPAPVGRMILIGGSDDCRRIRNRQSRRSNASKSERSFARPARGKPIGLYSPSNARSSSSASSRS